MAGTGLPLPKFGQVLSEPPGRIVSGDGGSSLWGEIASVGEKITAEGLDEHKLIEHQLKVGQIAKQDTADKLFFDELRAKYADDPEGFRKAAEGYSAGVLGQTDARLRGARAARLGSETSAGYGPALVKKNANDLNAAKSAWETRYTQAANEVQSYALAGGLHLPEGQAKVREFSDIVEAGKTSKFIQPGDADLRAANITEVASVYSTRAVIKDVFEREGSAAAADSIEKVTQNVGLRSLSIEQRTSLKSRLKAELHSWESGRTADLQPVKDEADALLAAIKSGTPVPMSRLEETVERFKAKGGMGEAASFLAGVRRFEEAKPIATAPYSEATRRVQDIQTRAGVGFEGALVRSESGGDPTIVNRLGYVGTYQFGAPRLAELGMYAPGEGENVGKGWSGEKWSGQINIPGFPNVKTLDDFRKSPDAQKAAYDAHIAKIDQQTKELGLDKFIGQTVGGVPVTQNGIRAMAHLGGINGTRRFLESGGEYNPSDGKTRLSDYGRRFANVEGGAAGSVEGTRASSLPEGAQPIGVNMMSRQQAAFGRPDTEGWQESNLATVKAPNGADIKVHKLAATAFEGFLKDLAASGYKIDSVSGFTGVRGKAVGQNPDGSYRYSDTNLSEHSWGNAIDINPGNNPFGRTGKTDMPDNVREIAKKWGLSWGGDWSGTKDPMHFEWTGRAPVGPASTNPADIKQAGDATTKLRERVNGDLDRITTTMRKPDGTLPTEQEMSDLFTAARTTGDAGVLDKFSEAATEWKQRRSMAGAPAPAVQSEQNRLNQAGQTTGIDEDERKRLDTAKSVLAEREKAFGSGGDRLEYGLRTMADSPPAIRSPDGTATAVPVPAPLDFRNPDAFRAGLAQRAHWANKATVQLQQGDVPALTKTDAAQINAFLDAAPAKDQARLYSDILAALPNERQRNATLGMLGADGPQAMTRAFAGALYATNPEIATSILQGAEVIKVDARNDPTKTGEGGAKKSWTDALDKALPAVAFPHSTITNPSGAYATMRTAVTMRYAYLTATQTTVPGGPSKEFDEKRLTQAVNDVTGGIVTHNGMSIIAPQRGMDQKRFDGILFGIKDEDLAGVTTLTGQPVTAAYLRQNAKLESRADGQYLIRIGNKHDQPVYAVKGANTEVPEPFVLDLKDRQPGAPVRRGGSLQRGDAVRGMSTPGNPAMLPPVVVTPDEPTPASPL